MKLIQAMKQLKALSMKVDDLQGKILANAACMDYEKPLYGDRQADQIAEWVQSAMDSIKEMERLRLCIQRTNLVTPVTIELHGRQVTKSIAGWIHRRRDLAGRALGIVSALSDGTRRDGFIGGTAGAPGTPTKVVRFYSPERRDAAREEFRTEPGIIDSTLEVINAVTDLIETE